MSAVFSGEKNDNDIFISSQIWTTAVKQGLVSACYFWVGSEVPIEGKIISKRRK